MPEHSPVLLDQAIEKLSSGDFDRKEGKIVDCTLGLGGYSERILETFPRAEIYGLDRDRSAIEVTERRLAAYGARFKAFHACFGDMEEVLKEVSPMDAFVFDLGVSNMQLTEADRGFSFQHNGPLDMRMNPDGSGRSAADVLNSLSAADLEKIFRTYGEERYARQIARAIEGSRKRGVLPGTTGGLVELIRATLPAPVQRKMGTHPARRVFQALRIYVNDELGELEAGLKSVEKLASSRAIVVVVSYHSLEDRIVKHTFRRWDREEKKGTILTKHPVVPDSGETERNFKARSAKLRAFQFL
jgi:16S rRNA (cytosine1402-N4)-methyltransferase